MTKHGKRSPSLASVAKSKGSSDKKRGRRHLAKAKAAEAEHDEEEELPQTPSAIGFQELDDRIEAILKFHRRNTNTWDAVCKDVEKELHELDLVLVKIGVPPHNFKKDKKFPFGEYEEPPELKTCFSKDFLDYFIFPQLIPAIQALIRFATKNRVFQCRYCTFNPLDYIVEYIYNNNPNHPERALNPVPLFEIPFAIDWVTRFPRKPYPRWLTMTEEEAVLIIQCAVRGWFVRRREPFRSMREKWKDQRKQVQAKKARPESAPLFSPYYSEITTAETTEDPSPQTPPPLLTHSDTCLVCNRFREFLRRQQELLLLSQPPVRVPSNENDMFATEAETLIFPRSLNLQSETMDG